MAARTGLKVFYDSFSQPSRAVLLLLHANNVKYESRMIKIAKGIIINYRKAMPEAILMTDYKPAFEYLRTLYSGL